VVSGSFVVLISKKSRKDFGSTGSSSSWVYPWPVLYFSNLVNLFLLMD
jgi:hypothetical protein